MSYNSIYTTHKCTKIKVFGSPNFYGDTGLEKRETFLIERKDDSEFGAKYHGESFPGSRTGPI